MKIVLVTGHDYDSPRKTGFHFWANILAERGHEVFFLTVGQSKLTPLIGNHKVFDPPYNCWVTKKPRVQKFVWMPLFHPFRLKFDFLTKIFSPFFSYLYAKMLPYAFEEKIRGADTIIVEVGAGLILVQRLRKLCPNARFIYTVSDRLSTLNAHPCVVDDEESALPHFFRIRVPASIMLEDYKYFPAVYIPQGIDKEVFEKKHPNPYKQNKNAISVGDMLFDPRAIEIMAGKFPDWTFHVFGRKANLQDKRPNVIVYGEKPFDEITPYIQHADIALAPYKFEESAAYLAQSSLKMLQYTFCRLPIVAPTFAAQGRDHAIGYVPDDEQSIVTAFEKAVTYDRESIIVDDVLDWNQVIDRMMG